MDNNISIKVQDNNNKVDKLKVNENKSHANIGVK
jgi:hypothetical protein